MPRLFKKLGDLLINTWSWLLDYAYITYSQLLGFFDHSEPNMYRSRNRASKGSIILIPGIYEKWFFMKPIADVLHRNGYDVHIIEKLGYGIETIEIMARVVSEYIVDSGITKCAVVAHSKGGLVGKYVLANYNPSNIVRGIVAINTPFSGSRYAYFMPMKSIRVFIPTSSTLRSLSLNITVNKQVVSVYGRFDPHVPLGSHLNGAQNIVLNVRGHFRVVSSPAVHRVLLESVSGLLKT